MLAAHAVPILVVVGLVTAAAGAMFLAPRLLVRLLFGVDSDDAFTLLLARHWGLLAGSMGALLVYSAFHAEVRGPVVVAAIVEKLALTPLVFLGRWRRTPAGTRLALGDVVMAVLLAGCLGR